MRLVTCGSPDNLGLITLCGTVIAPRPFRPWRAPAERRRLRTSERRVRENRILDGERLETEPRPPRQPFTLRRRVGYERAMNCSVNVVFSPRTGEFL